jgi:lactam utilization protein B
MIPNDIKICHACLDLQLCDACARAWAKLERCVKLARDSNHDYLQTKDRIYLTIRDEAMADARYWEEQLS